METRDELNVRKQALTDAGKEAIALLNGASPYQYEVSLWDYWLEKRTPHPLDDDYFKQQIRQVPKDNTSIFKVPALPSTKRKRGDKRDNEHGNQENKRFNPGKSGP